jgi:hypothetical protein
MMAPALPSPGGRCNIDLGLFCRAMGRWAGMPEAEAGRGAEREVERTALARSWRRSAVATWASLAAVGAFAVVRVVQVAGGSRPFDDMWSPVELDGASGTVLFLLALGLGVVPLFGVAASTGHTREALTPPVVIAPGRPLPGGGG